MIDPGKLYTVRGPDGFWSLAIGVQVEEGRLDFHDTGRGHRWEGRLERETRDGFVWRRVEDTLESGLVDFGQYTFRVVTAARFTKEVQPRLEPGGPDAFHSDAELHEWFRRQFAPWVAR